MKQTPVTDIANQDVLNLIPAGCKRIVEVGSSSGALARAYKSRDAACHYTGIEIDAEYAALSRRYCDEVLHASIETLDDQAFDALFPADCWVFGDVLEHLYDPWSVLKRIRVRMAAGECVVACVPNVQHWTIQAKINVGDFVYEDSGLLDRTHLRWFTRKTALALFQSTGYRIVEGSGRIFADMEPGEKIRAAIRTMAAAVGADADTAVNDALTFQWVVRAVPA